MAKDHPTGQSGLYEAFLQLKTPEQCYRFLQDVCSYSELSAMEQRYNIAELLADKCIYTEIMDKTGASSAIISRVSRVLSADDSVLRALLEAEQKAIKLLSELEEKAGLIERKRQGLGKPNLIYVKNFISAVDSQLLNCENHNSGTMEITTQELPKSQCNNTDIKNTEFSDTDSIFPSGNGGMMDENDRYQEYFDYFSDQLSMDLLKKDYPYDSEMLDNILELIVETVCTKRPLIRIGAEERPAEIVRSRFMKLNAEHIRYVMDCFKENTTKIRNIRQYMLTTIYNAPTTIDTYYDALVRHDMSHGYLEGGFKKLKMKREEGE
jgi:TrpR-related protein YerC/YecD